MTAPQISVVIPTKDRRDLCVAAVESCLAADDTVIEVIVVDDGSTDDTEAALSHLPVRYVRQDWAGRSTARNRGVTLAQAPLVAFLDSDDLCLTGRFRRQLAGMREEHVASWGQVTMVTQTGEPLLEPTSRIQREIAETAVQQATLERLAVRMRIYPSTVIVRRSVFDEVGGFDENLYVAEDVEWLLRLRRLGPFAFEPEPVAAIRRHEGNSSSEQMFREAAQFTVRLAAAAPSTADRAYRARLQYYRARALWSLGDNRGAFAAGWASVREDASILREPGFVKRFLLSALPSRASDPLRRLARAQKETNPSSNARHSGP